MPLKIVDRARQTLAWRLIVWYSVIFILSSLAVAIVSYVFVSSSLRDNRRAIEVKISHLAELADSGGIVAVEHAASLRPGAKRRKSFFVRILDGEGRVVFINSPHLWNKFEPAVDVTDIVEGAWQYLPSDGDVLEISSARLTGGYLLQVGRTLEDREEILENYRKTIAAVTIPIVVIAFGGGIFFALRAVRPIRDLIGTTHAIVETGRVDVRVPEKSATGELAQLVRLFNKMLDRIEALIAGMKQSVDNVAHDLRTPMTRLRGVAEMALRSESPPQQYHESLATCVEESDRILTLLNALMDISEARNRNYAAPARDVRCFGTDSAERRIVRVRCRREGHLDRGRLSAGDSDSCRPEPDPPGSRQSAGQRNQIYEPLGTRRNLRAQY